MNHIPDFTRRGALVGMGAAALGVASGLQVQAAAPMQGPLTPDVYRFKLGGFEVTTIHDGAIQLDGPHPIFGQDQTAEAVAALTAENFLPSDKMEIGFTPTILNTGAELILFDTGNGAGRRPSAGQLRARLARAGLTPEQVDVVVITHFHPDHIGGMMEDGSPAYPNARYVTTSAEYDFWSPVEMASGKTERVGKLVQSNVVPMAEKFSFVGDGDAITSGVTVVDASGHTPGHMAVHLESEGRRLLITADACNHYVVSMQRPDWHVRFDMDKAAAAATRRNLLGMAAADGIPFVGYHMPFPAVGFAEAEGDGFRYHAASYQMSL